MYIVYLKIILFFVAKKKKIATAGGDTTREDGKEAEQNRDPDACQELHNGTDQCDMRHARRG